MSDLTRVHEVLDAVRADALLKHGDTAAGFLWPNELDWLTRFEVMLDVVETAPGAPFTLCDFACGSGELLGYLRRSGRSHVDYIGVDRSESAIALAREKFPDARFFAADVSDARFDTASLACDYLVINGLFTVKASLSYDEMWAFFTQTIARVWPQVRRGMAFNVMSKCVDWERDDLFHVPLDDVARVLHALAGRNVRFRADYGLYEYTAYARKQPAPSAHPRAEPAQNASVPVLRPQLPTVEKLVPYLRGIDDRRTYSNHGPLVLEFERRIARELTLEPGRFTSAASGTAAIVGAVLAAAGRARPDKPYAFIAAFTFVGTAVAVEQCGYRPYLTDCDAATWTITPELVTAAPDFERCGLVVVTSPLGRPVAQAPWSAFSERYGIPVVIDGAACFDLIRRRPADFVGSIPVAFSFHATKAFGIGEGGGVATTDARLAARITQALNFGFHGRRDCSSASINGKLSEYHAAIGLAELEGWNEKERRLYSIAAAYRESFDATEHAKSLHTAPDIGCSYVIYEAETVAESESVAARLELAGIGSRFWYGNGIHRNTYYRDAAAATLDVTTCLAPRLIGLPLAPDLERAVIQRIVETICLESP
ncbi:MAG: DegT/DnrJ/EryC1/StrS family aminotransferase [Candidatus Baltobacteraceae bacterium]